jgi:hypothetical protein
MCPRLDAMLRARDSISVPTGRVSLAIGNIYGHRGKSQTNANHPDGNKQISGSLRLRLLDTFADSIQRSALELGVPRLPFVAEGRDMLFDVTQLGPEVNFDLVRFTSSPGASTPADGSSNEQSSHHGGWFSLADNHALQLSERTPLLRLTSHRTFHLDNSESLSLAWAVR